MIECYFCRRTVPDVETAIDADWLPSFHREGDVWETDGQVCPLCRERKLVWDETAGDYVLPANPPPVVLDDPEE